MHWLPFILATLAVQADARSGGPGPGGYYYEDSNEPGGPLYSFEDISTTGALSYVTDIDDDFEMVYLPFTFDFYGIGYTSVSFQTNGVIGMVNSEIPYTNACLPYGASPYGTTSTYYGVQTFIAGFWDDLDPGDGGDMYWEVRGTPGADQRAIFQWQDVYHFSNGPSVRFQIILWESGTITMAYDDTQFGTDSTTIGIQGDATYNFFEYDCDVYGGSITAPLLIEWSAGSPPAPEDSDGDGYLSIADGGGDCDDEDPAINPGAYDIPGDGIDQDCNGSDAVETTDTGSITDTGTGTGTGTGGAGTGTGTTGSTTAGDPTIDGKLGCGCSGGGTEPAGALGFLGLLGLLGLRRRSEGDR